MPSTPRASAPAWSPAPTRRALTAVVPYARKMHIPTAVDSTTAAAPSPASGAVPRVATTAESASRKSGSATSAPSAGIASRAISRSRPGAGGRVSGTPSTVRPPPSDP